MVIVSDLVLLFLATVFSSFVFIPNYQLCIMHYALFLLSSSPIINYALCIMHYALF